MLAWSKTFRKKIITIIPSSSWSLRMYANPPRSARKYGSRTGAGSSAAAGGRRTSAPISAAQTRNEIASTVIALFGPIQLISSPPSGAPTSVAVRVKPSYDEVTRIIFTPAARPSA